MKKKVLVAMSGGVDSTVAAALLVEKGYEVTGATMKLFSDADIVQSKASGTCCSLTDVEDARRAAIKLGFEHFVFNFGSHFEKDVISRFVNAYAGGETPNPCVDCNRYIKFDKLLERALLLGMDYIATGHYARTEFDDKSGRWLLKRAADPSKDQTYFLYSMTQEQLKRTLFPLGGLHKSQVREIAEKLGLANASKPESQDICFVPEGDYAAFLEKRLGSKPEPGPIIDTEGNLLGTHEGLIKYTIGQRKGLGIYRGRPMYVIKKDIPANTLVVGDETKLHITEFFVRDINLISQESIDGPLRVSVKMRHSQKETSAVLRMADEGLISVRLDEPRRAIAPGQAAVFYSGDIVIGGGTAAGSPGISGRRNKL